MQSCNFTESYNFSLYGVYPTYTLYILSSPMLCKSAMCNSFKIPTRGTGKNIFCHEHLGIFVCDICSANVSVTGFRGVTFYGRLAQLGEHIPYKDGVAGSSPVLSTKKLSSVPIGGNSGNPLMMRVMMRTLQ